MSLRLSRNITKPPGESVVIRSPRPDANKPYGVFSVTLDRFKELLREDGFGQLFWNDNRGEAFVSIEVRDNHLIAEFLQARVQSVENLPVLLHNSAA